MLLRQLSLNVDTKQKTTTFLLMKLAIIIAVAFVFIVSAPKGLLAVDSISQIERLSAKIDYKQLFPEAARMGAPEGEPKAAPMYDGDNALIGYIFVNTDFVPTIGYSGKPIHVVIAMDMQGSIRGAKLLEHSEPIVLVGIPNAKIKAFIDGYVGLNAITLNGIAQGAITDYLHAMLQREGFENIMLNTGEIRAHGYSANGDLWRAALGSKDGPVLSLENQSLATSEVGDKRAHLFNPKTQEKGSLFQRVSVTAPSAAIADGLSTAFSLIPESQWPYYVDRLPWQNISINAARKDGSVFVMSSNGAVKGT